MHYLQEHINMWANTLCHVTWTTGLSLNGQHKEWVHLRDIGRWMAFQSWRSCPPAPVMERGVQQIPTNPPPRPPPHVHPYWLAFYSPDILDVVGCKLSQRFPAWTRQTWRRAKVFHIPDKFQSHRAVHRELKERRCRKLQPLDTWWLHNAKLTLSWSLLVIFATGRNSKRLAHGSVSQKLQCVDSLESKSEGDSHSGWSMKSQSQQVPVLMVTLILSRV